MDKCLTEMRDEELWQLFPIILVPYDASWPEAYRSESLRLREAVGSDIVRISHIGSTAVPGLTAKPTIDILLGKKRYFPAVPARTYGDLRLSLHAAAAESAAGNDVYERLYPPRLRGQTYLLHVRYPGDWDELYFRDYPCINAEAAARYAALKLRLMRLYEHDRDAYTAAKGGFIRECTARARALRPGKHLP